MTHCTSIPVWISSTFLRYPGFRRHLISHDASTYVDNSSPEKRLLKFALRQLCHPLALLSSRPAMSATFHRGSTEAKRPRFGWVEPVVTISTSNTRISGYVTCLSVNHPRTCNESQACKLSHEVHRYECSSGCTRRHLPSSWLRAVLSTSARGAFLITGPGVMIRIANLRFHALGSSGRPRVRVVARVSKVDV